MICGSNRNHRGQRSMTRIIYALVVALAVALIASVIPARTDRIWIDPVTGSMKTQTCGLFSCSTPKVQPSALEAWIMRNGRRHNPKWHFLSTYCESVFGQPLARGCSLAPEIYPLHAGNLNTGFIESASDSEIVEFLRIMEEGNHSKKEQAVETACRKVIGLGR